MKKLLLAALSTAVMSSMSSAYAWEPTYYAGSNVAFWQYRQHDPRINDTISISSDFPIQSLEALAGAKLTPYTSVEARVGAGFNTAREMNDQGTGFGEVEMPFFGSLYFKPHLTNEKASLYGLLGVSTVSIDASSVAGNSDETETTAASYGIGVSFAINRQFDFTAEWKKLINADAYDMRGGSVGFVYKF